MSIILSEFPLPQVRLGCPLCPQEIPAMSPVVSNKEAYSVSTPGQDRSLSAWIEYVSAVITRGQGRFEAGAAALHLQHHTSQSEG